MEKKFIVIADYIISIVAFLFSIWICIINLTEMLKRFNGEYTFYSQRASLNDNEAIVYFGIWTLAFIFLSFLSLKNLIKKRFRAAIIYGVILFLMIIISTYVDTFFYNDLV